ncbi:MAG: hypothetical protein JST68_10165 [Bacteroidetes bacterium]|nr:hypothetical protein [Bacteroidota bacterium]
MAAVAVKIDFGNAYKIRLLSEDLRASTFTSDVKDGTVVVLRVEISSQPHVLLPSVFNLAFGPTDSKGKIDDKAEIAHKDYSKVFSSILLAGLTYLTEHPDHFLGIDGSNNARAYLYYRFIQQNFIYLDKYFEIYGVKYYVRISRFGKNQYDNPFDFDDVVPMNDRIVKGMVIRSNLMYNYFIFRLKK